MLGFTEGVGFLNSTCVEACSDPQAVGNVYPSVLVRRVHFSHLADVWTSEVSVPSAAVWLEGPDCQSRPTSSPNRLKALQD